MKRIIFFLICSSVYTVHAQMPAKAISYTLQVDLTKFDPGAADELDVTELLYETDVYYTADNVRTVNRVIKRPSDYELSFRSRLYQQASTDEYNIEYENKVLVIKEKHVYAPRATGKSKVILNYKCKEFTVVDYRGITFVFWVTDKLGKNVCPWGNFSLKGTALEVTASNGIHFMATDFASGEVGYNFFKVPEGFQSQTIPFPKPEKKTEK